MRNRRIGIRPERTRKMYRAFIRGQGGGSFRFANRSAAVTISASKWVSSDRRQARAMSYKRNQIEEAITRIIAPHCAKLPSELRTRIKRLLELDRSMGRKVRSNVAEEAHFAFFTERGPGTGAVVSFSEYEASALLNALRIMEHHWPQSFAVSIMRRVRPDLEREHARILRQSPEELFDQEAIRANAGAGDIAVSNTDPVFITIASQVHRAPDYGQSPPFSAVCRGVAKVSEFSRNVDASSVTLLEVVTLVHRLHHELQKTEPRRRGRG
jgi:hypothetical protein